MPQRALFARLAAVRRVAFYGAGRGGTHAGNGTVIVERIDNDTLLFHETLLLDGKRHSRDRKRWCQRQNALLLQRQRHHGFETIFAFTPANGIWQSAPFHCAPDVYRGSLHPAADRIALRVRVCGAHKDDVLQSVYTE